MQKSDLSPSPRTAPDRRRGGWLTLLTGALLMLPGAQCHRDETGIDEALEEARDETGAPADRRFQHGTDDAP